MPKKRENDTDGEGLIGVLEEVTAQEERLALLEWLGMTDADGISVIG